MKNVYLIGFMGTGKSTVARMLHKLYQFQVIEMDETIVRNQGIPISQIFQEYGEEYFRDLETELLKSLQNTEGMVISCGGGVVLRKENVENMKKNGTIVLLTATPENVLKRVKHDEKRPMLQGKKNVNAITELMEQRKTRYQDAADIVIATDRKSSKTIATEICRKIGGEL